MGKKRERRGWEGGRKEAKISSFCKILVKFHPSKWKDRVTRFHPSCMERQVWGADPKSMVQASV